MAVAFGVVFGIAILAALLWPPVYRSTGKILIEQQEIPTDFVRSAVTSYAAQRIQVISQRVMTSANLIGIIDKYKLYPGDRDRATREALVDRIRGDIKLDMISADVIDRGGQPTRATIAFSVSFDSRSPVTAAQVANELTTLYLSENVESRRQLAADTASFLKDESDRLGQRVAELESKVADFKREHGTDLPEYVQANMQMLDRSQEELRTIQSRMYTIDQQLVYLDAQLAQLSPMAASSTDGGERVLSPADRLKALQDELSSARARYNPDHPDIVRLTREVSSLQAQLGITDNAATNRSATSASDITRQLTSATAQLAAAREKYGSDHPDVERLQREVASLQLARTELPRAARPVELDPGQVDPTANNPLYIQIRAQRTVAHNERAALAAQIPIVRARVSDLERRQTVAPEVERKYIALQRDLAGERTKYNEVRQKQLEAQLAQNLETERKGERFTLIEPPLTPQAPVRPNRPAILLLGFVIAITGAVGLMLLLDTFDTRIRDRAHVFQLLGVPPLTVIPLMELDEDRAARSRRRRLIVASSVGIIIAGLVVVHIFVRPLDLVWLSLLNRFGA